MRQQIKTDAADCVAGRGSLDLRDIVFSTVCTLDASHNNGSPGRGHPKVNLHVAHAAARHVQHCHLLGLTLPRMLRCDLTWSVRINRTVICLCLYILCL